MTAGPPVVYDWISMTAFPEQRRAHQAIGKQRRHPRDNAHDRE